MHQFKKETLNQFENIIPAVKCGGRSIMTWGSFATLGPGQLVIKEKIN